MVEQLGEKNLPLRAIHTPGVAEGSTEYFPGAVAGEHFVAGGRSTGKLGLVELMEYGGGLAATLQTCKRSSAATHNVVIDIVLRMGGVVCDVREPVKCPFGAE